MFRSMYTNLQGLCIKVLDSHYPKFLRIKGTQAFIKVTKVDALADIHAPFFGPVLS